MARYGREYGRGGGGWESGRGRPGYDVDYRAGRWESPGWRVPGRTPAGREGLGPSVFGESREERSPRGYDRSYGGRGRGGYGAEYRGAVPSRGNPLVRRVREENADLVADYYREEAARRRG